MVERGASWKSFAAPSQGHELWQRWLDLRSSLHDEGILGGQRCGAQRSLDVIGAERSNGGCLCLDIDGVVEPKASRFARDFADLADVLLSRTRHLRVSSFRETSDRHRLLEMWALPVFSYS